jgi:hypothetical protein
MMQNSNSFILVLLHADTGLQLCEFVERDFPDFWASH